MTDQAITIEPTHITGERGQHYRVHHAGGVLVEDTWNPEYEAARALVAKGITGRVEARRHGIPHPGSTFIAERAAKVTVVENESDGPRLARWKPFPSRTVAPQTGVLDAAATLVAEEVS